MTEPPDDAAPEAGPKPTPGPKAGPRRRRRATGGVAPTREVADVPQRDAAEDWREGGPDDERMTREVPPHW